MSTRAFSWMETQLETTRGGEPAKQEPVFSRSTLWYLSLYSVFILTATAVIASRRHLWWDEIQTMMIATLPNMKAIWNALLTGADWQSPASFVPLHFLTELFGPAPLAGRLIGIVPYWLATLVLYVSVARRTTPLYGFIAMLFPSITGAFPYSFEMRPYASVLLLSACTFFSWQLTKEFRYRRFALPALTVSLGMLVCFHYNACLIALPLLVGEATIALRRRKVDYPVLISMVCAALPLIPLIPHLQAIRHYSTTYHMPHGFDSFFELYALLFSRLIILVPAALATFLIWRAFFNDEVSDASANWEGLPYWEIAAAAAFLFLPIIYFFLSMYTGALHYRHVLDTVIGASVLVAFLCYAWRRPLARFYGIAVALFVCSLLFNVSNRLRHPDEMFWGTYAEYADLLANRIPQVQASQEPIALGDGSYLLAYQYGTRDLAQRSFYVMGNPQWKDIAPDALFKRNFLQAFARMMPPGTIHAAEYADFIREHRHFLLYDPDKWLVKRLTDEGQDVRVETLLKVGPLYSVSIR